MQLIAIGLMFMFIFRFELSGAAGLSRFLSEYFQICTYGHGLVCYLIRI